LEPLIQKRNPRSLIIGMLPALYFDPDVSPKEAETLLTADLQKLQHLTTRYNLITVCTNLDAMPLTPSKGLGKTIYDSVNEIVRIKQFDQCTCIELVKKQKTTTIVRFAAGQLCLEEFGMVL
jgi:hypothetical protein